jgi:hypothetical protein
MSYFDSYASYETPLLHVLHDMPDGQGATPDVLEQFWQKFGEQIPGKHMTVVSGRPGQYKWHNIVGWAASTLTSRGLLEAPASGIWRITDAGRAFLAHRPSPVEDAKPSPPSVQRAASEGQVETPATAHAVLDAQLAAVRDFLNGRSSRPSDERLCDWVNFCYEFGLFREGRDLFRLVDPSQVNNWYYDRAKRLAKVCAMKVAGQA